MRNNWFSSPFFSINFSKCCVRAKARHKNIPSRGSWPKLSVRKPWIEWKQLLVGQVFLIFLIQCHDVRRSYSSYFICSLIFCYSLGSTRFFKVARAKHRWVTVHCTLLMCSHVMFLFVYIRFSGSENLERCIEIHFRQYSSSCLLIIMLAVLFR